MSAPNDWSERFAAHIKRRGITHLQAAHELKVGPSQVHYWATVSVPRERTRKRIARWSKGEVPVEVDPDASAHTN